MTFNEYQDFVGTVRLPSADAVYALFNLPGEVGELLSIEAKVRRDGWQEGTDLKIKKELGDILWHVAAIAKDNGFTLEDIAAANVAKLVDRKARDKLTGSGDDR